MRIAKLTFLIVIVFSIFYFSWLPEPSFKNQYLLPVWLIVWTDTYGRLRTAVPFVLLGFILNILFKKEKYLNYKALWFCFIIVALAETGQLLLPKRVPDFWDVFYGMLGSVMGMLVSGILHKFYRVLFKS